MLRIFCTLVGTLLIVLSQSVHADCEAFAKYGIYDVRSSTSDTERAEAFRLWFCQQNFQSQQSASAAGGELGYGGFTLGYDQSKESWSEFKSSYCRDESYNARFKQRTEEFVKTINPTASKNMLACFNRTGAVHTRLEQGGDSNVFRFYAAFYTATSGAATAEVKNFEVKGGTCTSPLKKGDHLGAEGYESLCSRTGNGPVDVTLNTDWPVAWDTPNSLPVVFTPPPPPKPQQIDILAINVTRPFDVAWGGACTQNKDMLTNRAPCDARPNAAEFDFNVKVRGTYLMKVEYAAASSRPVIAILNGQVLTAQALSATTTNWNDAQWFDVATVDLREGVNTLRLARADVFPHIHAIRFVPVNK
ncbi:hypothetical protein [Paraburkholderia strydomiana]